MQGRPFSARQRKDFESDEEWWAWLDARDAVRMYSLVAATGWTLDQIAEADHYEVERMLRVGQVRAGVAEQYRQMGMRG